MTEHRLYVVTLLAGVYVVSWLAVARPTASSDESPPPVLVAPAPTVSAPQGWHVVTPDEVAGVRTPAPRPVRAPARRVRTRSS